MSVSDGPTVSDVTLVRQYVSAISDRDVDAAMRLRCPSLRVDRDRRDQFTTELSLILDEVGPLRVAEVEEVSHGPDPADDGEDPVHLAYQLAGMQGQLGGRLLTTAITIKGERYLCGSSPEDYSDVLERRFPEVADSPSSIVEPPDLGQAASAPRELMPDLPDAGYHLDRDEAQSALVDSGQLEVWHRRWVRNEGRGSVEVAAIRHNSSEAAVAQASRWIAVAAPDSTAFFEPDASRGATGLRISASAWTWVQPPSIGPYVDRVVQLFGDTVVVIEVASLPTGSSHELADDLALATHARARG